LIDRHSKSRIPIYMIYYNHWRSPYSNMINSEIIELMGALK
jgi:hypothetical protein